MPQTLDQLIGEVAAESNARHRRQLLAGARGLWSAESVARLYEEVVRLLHVDLKQAERIALAAVWLSERIGDDASRASSLRAMAHIQYRKRKYEASLELYEKALAIQRQLGLESETARTLNSSLQSLIYLGRYAQALDHANQCRQIFERHGDRLRLARLDSNMGNVLYRQDRFDEALVLYRRAYRTFVEIGDSQDVAISLKNMATCQISLNLFREALATYEEARAYCSAHDMPLLVAAADYNIAYLYYLRGEYTRSIELYRQAREHCAIHGDAYRQALCDLDQSEMYLELNLIEEGAHLARRARAAFLELGMRYEAAKAQTNLAISLARHGESTEALALFRDARKLFEREDNRPWIATIDLYQALVFHQAGRLQQALALCRGAVKFFTCSPLFTKAVLSQLLLARIQLDLGQRVMARRVCRRALARLEREAMPALSYQAWYVMGLIEESLGDSSSAYAAYKKAHKHLENLRSHLKAEEMKIAFLKDKLEVYEALVRMCLQRKRSRASQEKAFEYIEQAKSRSLADLIAFRSQGLPAHRKTERAMVEQIAALRGELNWYSRTIQLLEGRALHAIAPQLVKLRRAARNCEQKLVEALSSLQLEDANYTSLQNATSVPLGTVRSSLPGDALLLEYYRVGERFYVCVLGRETLKIVRLGRVGEIRRIIQLLRFQLSKFRLGAAYMHTFEEQLLDATRAHLHELHQALIAPIVPLLSRAAHLIVAPHDFLHYLPFQAMLDERGEYLMDRFTVSLTPSASVYHLCSTRQNKARGKALVLGIPDPLAPQIEDEVRAVAAALPDAEVFLGEHATHEVLQQRGATARFIHIATHGEFRQDNPMFSSIRLGGSHLNLFDLYQLDLPCELITLSGCGTGLNAVVGGDELLGLVRGLLYAGTEAILATLWDVNDQSASEAMGLFYQFLKSNKPKAEALRDAARAVRGRYPHPFHWAPFVMVGKYK